MGKKRFDARDLMELAVKAMRDSVGERRPDGKASPLVGAVLWRPNGSVVTACRGELRDGDHAEFTLLERKHRHVAVGDGVLFATLEPCAPGSRNEPKRSCAERIVLARIRTVYVGIEDPDPTVDRKGIKFLQDNGVEVHMFDRDLQEQIRDVNRNFIEQAVERAEAAKEEKKPVVVKLSSLEEGRSTLAMQDFAEDALERYREALGVSDAIGSDAFARRLLTQGLVQEQAGGLRPTGFGMLLFGRSPRDVMPQAGLLATIHYPDGREEMRDFDGPLVSVPGELETWLRDKLPNTIDRSRMKRREVPAVPFEVIREGVVNALVHRNYEIAGAKCQLIVTPEVIKIMSPGEPLKPITLEQLNRFAAPMLSRNPPLHYVFAKMEMAEERGLGMKTLRDASHGAGIPRPSYSMEDPYLVLSVFRTPSKTDTPSASIQIREELDVLSFLASRGPSGSKAIAERFGWDERKVQRVLARLIDSGQIRRRGAARASKYELVKD
jgi:ATP-dependent DNA helicase RecG